MKPTILFVDDESINLFVLEKRFEREYNILTAESGEVALKLIKTSAPKLNALITDLRMSGIDGIELIRQTKELFPETQCFLLTGYEYNDQISNAVDSQLIDGFFKKPFDYEMIHKRLQETKPDDLV